MTLINTALRGTFHTAFTIYAYWFRAEVVVTSHHRFDEERSAKIHQMSFTAQAPMPI